MTTTPPARLRLLFVCIHNSARSQMAEAFANRCAGERLGPGALLAESAGIEPGRMNPIVVQTMAELGYDLSAATTKGVADLIARGGAWDIVVTVCDEGAAARCPTIPGRHRRLHWGFPDPSAIAGDASARLAATRPIRDQIALTVAAFIDGLAAGRGT